MNQKLCDIHIKSQSSVILQFYFLLFFICKISLLLYYKHFPHLNVFRMYRKCTSFIQLHKGIIYFSKPHEFNFVQKTLFLCKAQKWKELFEKLVLALQMMAM